MSPEDTIKTLQHLISKHDELSTKNGELRAAINVMLIRPDLIQDEKGRGQSRGE